MPIEEYSFPKGEGFWFQKLADARGSAINEALMFSVKNEIFILPLRRKNSTVQAKRVLDFSDA